MGAVEEYLARIGAKSGALPQGALGATYDINGQQYYVPDTTGGYHGTAPEIQQNGMLAYLSNPYLAQSYKDAALAGQIDFNNPGQPAQNANANPMQAAAQARTQTPTAPVSQAAAQSPVSYPRQQFDTQLANYKQQQTDYRSAANLRIKQANTAQQPTPPVEASATPTGPVSKPLAAQYNPGRLRTAAQLRLKRTQ